MLTKEATEARKGDNSSLSTLTIMSQDVTIAQLNLDVLLAPAHVAFLNLASFRTVRFPFDYLLFPPLNDVLGQISTFLHQLFFFSEVPNTTGT